MSVQRWNEEMLVVQLSNDPQLSEDMAEVKDRLHGHCCDVVLDLADVTLITSSGLSKLLRLRKYMIDAHRRLILCSIQDRVWSVFLATGLDTIFEFTDTVTEALTRIQGAKT